MSERTLTIEDLRVHYRPENALPNQIKQRRVTPADLIQVLRSLPETREVKSVKNWTGEEWLIHLYVKSGTYLMAPVDGLPGEE
jgi:hypothetical protein